jgi:hypothetical protein
MSPSIVLRPGYFFTLIFSSAMIGGAALPVIMPDLFGLPAPAGMAVMLAGVIAGIGLVLRWPTARPLTLVFLAALISLSAWLVFTRPSITVISWGILGSIFAILLATLLLSRTIRIYESGR